MFTKQLIEEIKKKLFVLGKSDSLFEETKDLNRNDFFAVVKDGENKKITVEDFVDSDGFLNKLKEVLPERNVTYENCTFNNATDGIDITEKEISGGMMLRLADRLATDGLGYKILRKTNGEGNPLTFQSQVDAPNTIYEIRYEFDLNEESFTMPENSALYFTGGRLTNGTTLIGNHSVIASIFPASTALNGITLEGSWETQEFDVENSWGEDETKPLSQAWLTDEHTAVWQEFNRVWSAMSSGGSEVTLSVSPSNIFVREQTSITIDASIDASPSLITVGRLKKNGNIIAGATLSGNSIHYVDNLNVTSSGNTTYTAEFFLSSDTNPKSKSSTVKAVNRIYYGAGTIYTDARNTTNNPKTNPEGSYNVTITSDGQYVFFNVPSTMTINGATLSGFEFPLDSPTTVSIDGTNYKSYRSSNNFRASAGTITIIVY